MNKIVKDACNSVCYYAGCRYRASRCCLRHYQRTRLRQQNEKAKQDCLQRGSRQMPDSFEAIDAAMPIQKPILQQHCVSCLTGRC